MEVIVNVGRDILNLFSYLSGVLDVPIAEIGGVSVSLGGLFAGAIVLTILTIRVVKFVADW